MRQCARAFSVAIVGFLALAGAAVETARAECSVQAPLRPVHRTYIRRDVVEPGVYEVTRSPSVYGWAHATVEKRVRVRRGRRWVERTLSSVGLAHRRILLRPYKNYAHFQRPAIALSREHVAVQPEGARWVPAGAAPDCQE
ncbi:MAG: hypothetical protein WAN43_14065 [Rhodomicrobium sp.]|jgi:hypothetical protein